MNEIAAFFAQIWNVLSTPMNLPFLGNTSPLLMMLFLGVLSILVNFVHTVWGVDDD